MLNVCANHKREADKEEFFHACPYCKIDRLAAENAKLQQIVEGRTCFYSDEAVNEEVTRLRERNKRQHEEIKKLEHYGFGQDEALNKMGADNADLRRQLTEQSVMINSLTRQVGELHEENNANRSEYNRLIILANKRADNAEAALEQARLDSHLAGMEEGKEERSMAYSALFAVRFDPAWHCYLLEETKQKVADILRKMIANNDSARIEEKKHAQS